MVDHRRARRTRITTRRNRRYVPLLSRRSQTVAEGTGRRGMAAQTLNKRPSASAAIIPSFLYTNSLGSGVFMVERQMLDYEKEHRPGLGFTKRFATGFPMDMAARHRVRPCHSYRTAPHVAPS